MKQQPSSLEQLLDRMDEAGEGEEAVSLDKLMETIGKRSFGPILLLIGLILISPLSGIPTLPSTMGVAVFLIAVQMLVLRKHIWLPGWILRRKIGQQKLAKASQWLRRPARFVDRLVKHRLSILVDGPGSWPIALVCLVLAVTLPLLEPVPFAASSAGLALTCFGLAMTAHDGVLALLAYSITLGVGWLIANSFM
ncbi:exopolysaccharide biosynthesis protein [Halopseudomonas sp. SMJS2]|uniref:exopolysaccharide biosynthesis protein n=1 Tax=Halopseudomonas sp. SMJS2 TaxID=3041098 RepID=UPI002452EB49|nr:exopolysaccharide biosynthesis protein [Halopseudomonas sp. SMJS2]WGK62347.1 exopolysaccharide biosynthesis protein [Halopseudomonas sp. SMJS2]